MNSMRCVYALVSGYSVPARISAIPCRPSVPLSAGTSHARATLPALERIRTSKQARFMIRRPTNGSARLYGSAARGLLLIENLRFQHEAGGRRVTKLSAEVCVVECKHEELIRIGLVV